jgi:hypothetical protein
MGGCAPVHFSLCSGNNSQFLSSTLVVRDVIRSQTLDGVDRMVSALAGLNGVAHGSDSPLWAPIRGYERFSLSPDNSSLFPGFFFAVWCVMYIWALDGTGGLVPTCVGLNGESWMESLDIFSMGDRANECFSLSAAVSSLSVCSIIVFPCAAHVWACV